MKRFLIVLAVLVPLAASAQSVARTAGTCTAITTSNNLVTTNSTRSGLIITVPAGVAKRVRYSLSATATTSSPTLEPGQVLVLTNTFKGPISFISDDGATSTTVCISEW